MLDERDLFLIRILEKVTLANNRQLMILAGYRDPSVTRKRINKLKKEGYIDSGWIGDHLGYTLSQAGLSEIESERIPYKIKGIKSEHEELVTEAACWIYIRSDRSIMEMLFDREIRTQFENIGHRPDIIFTMHQALEVELTSKSSVRLEKNFKNNATHYGRQTWVIPKYKEGMKARLMKLSKKYGVERYCTIISVEELKKQVAAYDISLNHPRTSPVKGIPSIIKRESKEVILSD